MRSRLSAILRHARDNVPFYFGQIPVEDDNPLALLERLPLLNRETIRRAGHRLHALSDTSAEWRATHTSGTTGEPVTVVFDLAPQELEFALLVEHAKRLGIPQGAEIVHLTMHAPNSSQALRAPWGDGRVLMKWNLAWVWQRDDEAFIRSMNWLDGRILTAKPSVLVLLVERLRGRSIRPGGIIMSGETLSNDTRRLVEEAFLCPVSSLYTMAEVGVVGSECTTADSGYHVEGASAYVEIVDGEVVVTPLSNFAMPLIHYRTGDRAHWMLGECSCGRTEPRLILTSTRSQRHLVKPSGELVEISKFMAALSQLPVERISLSQEGLGRVRVDYRAPEPLSEPSRKRAALPLRAALGLETDVRFVRQSGPTWPVAAGNLVHPASSAVPLDLTAADVSSWLISRLTGWGVRPDAAVLTGSVLRASARSRFSDVDLTLFTNLEPELWVKLVRLLRQDLPVLRVTVTDAKRLEAFAPLATCRVICEGRAVIGSKPELTWPQPRALGVEGVHWCSSAVETLWHQLTGPLSSPAETLRIAYLAQKVIINACRYRHVFFGGRDTEADLVVAAELDGAEGAIAVEAIEVAREHRPPPPDENAGRRYLSAARTVAGLVADEIVEELGWNTIRNDFGNQ